VHRNCPQGPTTGFEPTLNPDRYNTPPIKETHNCWAYGMNVIDPAQLSQCDGKGPTCSKLFHQPGGTKGMSDVLQEVNGRTCKEVSRLMKMDVPGLKRTTFKARCPAMSSKIALVVDPGEDYHFYRQDPDGFWSHKDGGNTVKRYDAEKRPIWNPKTAARDYRHNGSFLNYEDFCGFWCAPRRAPIKLAQ
jgi:hypothetical protein